MRTACARLAMIADIGVAHVVGGVITLLLVAYSIVLLRTARRHDRRGAERSEAADE